MRAHPGAPIKDLPDETVDLLAAKGSTRSTRMTARREQEHRAVARLTTAVVEVVDAAALVAQAGEQLDSTLARSLTRLARALNDERLHRYTKR